MVQAGYLASTVLMGLFLVIVAILFARHEDWRDYSSEVPGRRSSLSRVAGNPITWLVGFVGLVLAVAGGALLYVGGGPEMSEAVRNVVGFGLMGVLAAVLAVFLVVGVYAMERHKGGSSAQGIAEGLSLLGLLFVVIVAVYLLMGG